jgi:hypothetical protein
MKINKGEIRYNFDGEREGAWAKRVWSKAMRATARAEARAEASAPRLSRVTRVVEREDDTCLARFQCENFGLCNLTATGTPERDDRWSTALHRWVEVDEEIDYAFLKWAERTGNDEAIQRHLAVANAFLRRAFPADYVGR